MAEAQRDSAPPDSEAAAANARWALNLLLFALTVISSFGTGAFYSGRIKLDGLLDIPLLFVRVLFDHEVMRAGAPLAVPLLGILVVHELGHLIAARLHGVPASLPYFLPFPLISPFGTAGAIIGMRGRIRSRSALLDIGAAGPIAGLLVALPVLAWGLAHSPVEPLPQGEHQIEGQSLLYWLMKLLVLGPIPDGHDVVLHPTAWAGWGGLLITMLNLLPIGQLDGGHIAYALFGKAQDRFSTWIRHALLGVFVFNLLRFSVPVALGRSNMGYGYAFANSVSWLFLFGLMQLMTSLGGDEHPPFEPGPLPAWRRAVGWFCLILLVLLFMPSLMTNYPG
jgi:membrane-associated protease RseP (regulator of RpoE activity)